MRKSMIKNVSNLIEGNENTALFLVDIGVWAFRDILKKYPNRALNVGIFEDGMTSIMAGTALEGIIPTVYGISPFIINRAMEQLKLDFAYQKLPGNFITTGASYDFSTLGYSHYCPEDLAVIQSIPGFEFVAPGTANQFEQLFKETCLNNNPTYYRLSDYCNHYQMDVSFGKANEVKKGSKGTVVAVSTTLDMVLEACGDIDVSILYYTTLLPFDRMTLQKHYNTGRILVCEPHYEGTLAYEIQKSFVGEMIKTDFVGVKREILRNYGTKAENDEYNGLTVENIKRKLAELLK